MNNEMEKKNDVNKEINATNKVEEVVEETADAVEEVVEETKVGANELSAPTQTAEVTDERDEAAENLIRWGAARAGVVVVTPLLGGIALMANEVYMISRMAKVYGVKLSDRTIMAFLGAFGARVVGTAAVSMIPIPGISLPVAISVTYGVGRVAQSWIKDGLPMDIKPYVEQFDTMKAEGEAQVEELAEHSKKDIPLGDESKDFTEGSCPIRSGAGKVAGTIDKAFTELLLMLGVSQESINDKKALAQGVYEVAKETTEEVAGDLKVKMKEAGADAKLRAELLRDQAEEKAAEAKEKSEEFREQAKERAEEFRGKAKDKAAEMKERVEEKAEEARERAEEIKEEAADKAEDVKEAVEEKAEEARERAEEIKKEAADKAEDVKDAVEEKAEDAKETAEEKTEDAKEAVEEKVEDTKDAVEEKAEEVKEAAEDAKE